ncbi:MAG: hypothetical protein PHP06_02255 [Clostridia bacterium]|nr:hypothetical protein [Clostridia bacterium]
MKNIDVFGILGFGLGALGFIFGISATFQLTDLKKRIQVLEEKIRNKADTGTDDENYN